MEQIVPYTSPGFEIIWRCQTYSIGFEEASESLRQLYRADPQGFSRHVNPGGKSYIEEILRYPWARGKDQTQWELLILFMQEFGMTKGTDSVAFLVQCAKWIGEGPHLYLLEFLLDLGYDVSGVVGDFQDWPALSSPNWISEAITPDPFFIEYFKIVCIHNQGFAGMTPLHEAILLESTQTVDKWISKSKKDEKNSLGQTPLHLAVSDPQRLKTLIDSGHDVNMTDIHGITPLMYAAAVNQDESVTLLIEAGACINAGDKEYGRTFLHYAAVRGHWKLIFRFLVRLEGFADNWIVEGWAESAVLLYHVEYPNLGNLEMREVFLGQLLMKCRTANLTFDDMTSGIKDNCLLHYNTRITDFEALLDQGFRLFNHMNSKGQTPLMVAAELGEPDLVRKLVEVGADVNLKDLHHRTALHFALGRLEKSRGYGFWIAMETLRILLAGGANVFTTDGYRCPCSSFGRLSVADLLNSSRHWWQGTWEKPPIAAMELLCLTVEYRGAEEGKDLLLSFIRWEKHEELGMSHLCFQRHPADGLYGSVASSRPLCMQDEEVDDILDEESEFLAILESEMEESSAKDFEHLLKDWLRQMKSRLDKVVEEKSRSHAKCVKGQAEVKHGYQVDYKRDCFYHNFVVDVDWPDPTRAIRSSLAMYIAWIEHEYDHGATARLAGPFHKDWYSTRTSMVHKFIEVFGIPTAEIAHALKRSDTTIEEERPRKSPASEKADTALSPMICKFFANGFCSRGDKCAFPHIYQSVPPGPSHEVVLEDVVSTGPAAEDSRSKIACVFFAKGHCRNGVKCAFSHDNVPEQAASAASEVAPSEPQEKCTRELLGAWVNFGSGASVEKVSLFSDFSTASILDLPARSDVAAVSRLLSRLGFDIPSIAIRARPQGTGGLMCAIIRAEDPDFAQSLYEKFKNPKIEEISGIPGLKVEVHKPLNHDTNKGFTHRVNRKKVICSWHKPKQLACLTFGSESAESEVRTTKDDIVSMIPQRQRPKSVKLEGLQDLDNTKSEIDLVEALLVDIGPLEMRLTADANCVGKRVKAMARFSDEADAMTAVRLLNSKPLPFNKDDKLSISRLHSASYKVANHIFSAVLVDFEKTAQTFSSKRVTFERFPSQHGYVTLRLESEKGVDLARAETYTDKILEGRLVYDAEGKKPLWSPSFNNKSLASRRLRPIERQHNVAFQCVPSKAEIHVFGSFEASRKACDALLQCFSDNPSTVHYIPLTSESLHWAIRGGFKAICEVLGQEAVSLNILATPKRLEVIGPRASFDTAIDILAKGRLPQGQDKTTGAEECCPPAPNTNTSLQEQL
ncbi:hypothetical protein CNYM01_09833 [Colletotrichum nymphaeae SA-01]|uniref:C3H1-type domain-containing protein n=1 Tax=Colletotrichum nymphaeae SA-01 TaxID=1460502 RepID=A0A135T0I9_9PEZI|nr:hypothetical protein CNYM01_09833 [Colletotrichum nymphaeae SA-01]